ncbi:MAG: hypothetical protein Q7U92_14640 [Bradyrhizobium sp.]|nr:hypothetical protein [Bradyrhizobium sp.]
MLPGFRFLFAAIVLSMSVLVFGLGAAALLRASHEQFASNSSLRAAPEPKFARQKGMATEREPEPPVLAMLRVEPEAAQQPATDGLAAAEPQAPADEKIAALKPEDLTPSEAAKPEIPTPDMLVPGGAPAPATEQAVIATEQALPPAPETVAEPEQAIAPSATDAGIAATQIATLGGPPVAIEAQQPAKTDTKADVKPDGSAAKKRLQARRAKERRRIALRARQAAQQQAADPFAQPATTTRSR